MLCLCPALLNPRVTPAVLPGPHRQHPSAQRFVQRPSSSHLLARIASLQNAHYGCSPETDRRRTARKLQATRISPQR